MTKSKPKRKPHSERGWAVIVTWRNRRGREDVAWETGEDGHRFGFPRAIFDNHKEAVSAKERFCNGNDSVEAARVVPVTITERRRKP